MATVEKPTAPKVSFTNLHPIVAETLIKTNFQFFSMMAGIGIFGGSIAFAGLLTSLSENLTLASGRADRPFPTAMVNVLSWSSCLFFSAVVLSALAVVPLGQYAAILQRGRVKEPYAMTIFRAIFLLQLLTPALNYAGTILLGVAVYVVAGNDIQRAAFYCFIAISGSALLFGTYVTSWTKLFIVAMSEFQKNAREEFDLQCLADEQPAEDSKAEEGNIDKRESSVARPRGASPPSEVSGGT